MSEKQEKVWVVLRWEFGYPDLSTPTKVFDDRKDAREFAKRYEARSQRFGYSVIGVRKG